MSAGSANFGIFTHRDAGDSISKGNIPGEESLLIQGINPDMGADVREDLWTEGGMFVYLSSPETMTYVSTDAADTETVFVSGVLAGVEVTEVVALAGLTPVAGAQLFDVINFMFLISGVTNVGVLRATAATALTVQCEMAPEQGITQHGMHRVPLGYNLIIRQVELNAARLAGGQAPLVLFNFYARFNTDSPWISLLDRRIDTAVQNEVVVPYPVSAIINGGADVRLSAISTQNSTEVAMRITCVQYKI